MHIIALEDEPTSLRGGQELNLFEICQGLAHRGHQISLIYGREGNLLESYRKFSDYTVRIGSYGFDRRRIASVVKFLPSIAGVQTIPTNRNSIIFSNSSQSVFFGYLLACYRRLPLICYLQSTPFQNEFNRQRLLGLTNVRQFISVSYSLRSYWAKLGFPEDKIDVVHNGTNLEKFKPAENFTALRKQWGISEDTKVIVYIGRLDREKGLDVLLKAFALLLNTHQNIRLLIAGKPVLVVDPKLIKPGSEEVANYQYFLENLAVHLGIEKQIDFLGHVTDTVSLYQVGDITVVPSRWPDPCPRVVIESMACGTPVVGSRIGGIPELLGDEFEANLVEPGNEKELAEVLRRTLDWRENDPFLGKRYRDRASHQFSLSKLVDGIEKVLLGIAHG